MQSKVFHSTYLKLQFYSPLCLQCPEECLTLSTCSMNVCGKTNECFVKISNAYMGKNWDLNPAPPSSRSAHSPPPAHPTLFYDFMQGVGSILPLSLWHVITMNNFFPLPIFLPPHPFRSAPRQCAQLASLNPAWLLTTHGIGSFVDGCVCNLQIWRRVYNSFYCLHLYIFTFNINVLHMCLICCFY